MTAPLFQLFIASLASVWKTAFPSLIGILLHRSGHYNSDIRSGISKIVVTAGMPCLLFINVSYAIGSSSTPALMAPS